LNFQNRAGRHGMSIAHKLHRFSGPQIGTEPNPTHQYYHNG
jgi:hypothetical protein